VILTGPELGAEVRRGRIVIDPFDESRLEPNSYGFRLARHIISYADSVIDAGRSPDHNSREIAEDGMLLVPGTLYLGSTVETMGSDHYAGTLYARRSISTLGMWIQVSAPLGHVGAIIPWTLEIRVMAPIIVYPEMTIGKIAFWEPSGDKLRYGGKYDDSRTTVPSRLAQEIPT
jgi:dCTP deaminase